MPIADKSILNAAFITNKAQVIADMEEQSKQQAQAQQAQAATQEKKDNAEVMAKFAKARSDLAREKELMASAQEKIAKIDDLEANAEHKKTQADLDLVKMMIELEDMDLANFRTALELAEAVKLSNSGRFGEHLYPNNQNTAMEAI